MENGDSGALDPERSLQPPDTDSEPPDTDSDGVRPPAPAGTSPALGDGIRRRVSDLSNGSGGPGEENLRGIAARRAALVTDDDGKAAERDTGMDVELPGTPSKARTPSEVDSQRDGEGKDPRQLPVNIGWGPDASPPGGVEEPAKWASSPRANGLSPPQVQGGWNAACKDPGPRFEMRCGGARLLRAPGASPTPDVCVGSHRHLSN